MFDPIITKPKTKPFEVMAGGKRISLTPAESLDRFQVTLDYRLDQNSIGGFLLSRGTGKNAVPVVVFGFQLLGLHNMLSDDELEASYEKIVSGLKDLPHRECLTIHFIANKSDRERQEELSEMIGVNPIDSLNLVLADDKRNTRRLAREGRREPKALYVYCTCPCRTVSGVERPDLLEKALLSMERALYSYQGKGREWKDKYLYDTLVGVFSTGFKAWESLLYTQMDLQVKALGPEELYAALDRRFNFDTLKSPPQRLIVTHAGLEERVDLDTHASSLLYRNETPVCTRSYLKVRGEYVGVLTLREKPDGWSDRRKQMHYLWDVIAKEQVTDTEIITQIQRLDSDLALQVAYRHATQAKAKTKKYEELNRSTRASMRNLKDADDLADSALDGDVPLSVSVTFIVRRSTLEKLDAACRHLSNCFQLPTLVLREADVAWDTFYRTLPISTRPLSRRVPLWATTAPALMSLVNTNVIQKRGFELIESDGETPIGIDFLDPRTFVHVLLTATNRHGKSLLAAGLLVHPLAQGCRVTIVDYPKQDGTSTYNVLTELLGEEYGAYVDVGKVSFNILERPRFRKSVSPETIAERRLEQQWFIVHILKVYVMGLDMGGSRATGQMLNPALIHAILTLAVRDFFNDPDIIARFEAAERDGLGSESWSRIPTLQDLPRFLTKERVRQRLSRLNLEGIDLDSLTVNDDELDRALATILLRLSALLDSKIGKCIGNPSTVSTNSQLMVFAFRQIDQSEDAALLALIATYRAFCASMETPVSIFYIDEAPILFQFETVVLCVHRIVANGAKSGIHTIISAQNPNTIANSKVGMDILANLSVKLTGKIQSTAIDDFVRLFNYDRELMRQCTRLRINYLALYSEWLLDFNGHLNFVRYYPSPTLVAMVANNQDEVIIRQMFLEQIDDRLQALLEFAKFFTSAVTRTETLLESARQYAREHFSNYDLSKLSFDNQPSEVISHETKPLPSLSGSQGRKVPL
jgi:hypothetical protein